MKVAKRVALIVAIALACTVGCIAASMPGPGPCYCDPGSNFGCALEDYMHFQSTVFVCGGEARWGRLP